MYGCGSSSGFFDYFVTRWSNWRKQREIRHNESLPEQTILEQPTSSTNGHSTSHPTLDELVRGYDLFLMAQRSLFEMRHPELGIGSNKMIKATKKMISSLEIESIPLALKFFNESFGPFKSLGKTQKVNIVVECFDDFTVFNKTYLTCLHFPNLEDERITASNGYYMTKNVTDYKWFFEGYVVPDRIKDYICIINPMRAKNLKHINKARILRPRKVDIVSFIFLSLWKHLEYANLLTDEMNAHKDKLMKEWLQSLKEEYGEKDMMSRFTQLMLFYYEADDLVIEFGKYKTVLRVYLLRNDESDWCDVQAHMKKLDLGADD